MNAACEVMPGRPWYGQITGRSVVRAPLLTGRRYEGVLVRWLLRAMQPDGAMQGAEQCPG